MPPLAQATWGHAEEERLREEGFVVIPSFLTSAGVVELNDMIDELLSEPSEAGYDWTCPWLFDHRAGRVLWELATQPALLEIMRSECGPNVCLWAGGLALKAAEKEREHTGEIPWHQDAPYWNIFPERHGVIWMAVEPVSRRNGTMMVMPGWHRKGCLPRHLDTERQGFTHNIAQEVLPTGEAMERLAFPYEFGAGDAAVHDIMMPHTSPPNTSNAPRRALNLRYCSAEGLLGANTYVNPLTGESRPREFILVCGEDTAGRGFGRKPIWMQQADGEEVRAYLGEELEEAVKTERHERPAGEPGSYALTNLADSSGAAVELAQHSAAARL